jgi:hypothetical protein
VTDIDSLTYEEYGAYLASLAPRITQEQAEAAARILITVEPGTGVPITRTDSPS